MSAEARLVEWLASRRTDRPAPSPSSLASFIAQAEEACGIGFHRGPNGGCRPNVAVVVAPTVVAALVSTAAFRPLICYDLNPPEASNSSTLTPQFIAIRAAFKAGVKASQIARQFGLCLADMRRWRAVHRDECGAVASNRGRDSCIKLGKIDVAAPPYRARPRRVGICSTSVRLGASAPANLLPIASTACCATLSARCA
jgi:hypothetical protein